MKLDYVDPESDEQDRRIHRVSGEMAGRAYNALCKMLGGRWPDCRIETYAPEAHEFFMTLFSEVQETKEVSCEACKDTGYTHGPPGSFGMTPCYLCGKGDWVGIPHGRF